MQTAVSVPIRPAFFLVLGWRSIYVVPIRFGLFAKSEAALCRSEEDTHNAVVCESS